MKTDDLIRALVVDGSRPIGTIGHGLFKALALGCALSLGLALMILHPRPDIGHAIYTLRFDFKLLVALILFCSTAILLTETARPISTGRRGWTLIAAPALLAAGVVVELAITPPESWAPRLVGHNASHCLSLIPLLSLPPLACLLLALRSGAPSYPVLAGAAAGLASGGLGALLYAVTCPDDSPLFVATWYSIAIALVTATSAMIGRRLLRW